MANVKYALLDTDFISKMHLIRKDDQNKLIDKIMAIWNEYIFDYLKEYSGSKYTNSIKGTNAKAKANVATGLPEMIEISVGKHFRENQEDKHKRDAKNGWYRYDSQFALPVYDDKGELERYNIFHASMLVRHSNDEKLYLYDVIDIKKETSNSLGE